VNTLFLILLIIVVLVFISEIIKPSINKKTGEPFSKKSTLSGLLIFIVILLFLYVITRPKATPPVSSEVKVTESENQNQLENVAEEVSENTKDVIENVTKEENVEITKEMLNEPAAKTLINFIEAIKKRNWAGAVQYSQLSWQSKRSQYERAQFMEINFDPYKIKSYKIISKDIDSDSYKSYTVRVEGVNVLKNEVHLEMKANVICETMGGPDPNGKWGVNPSSAIMSPL